MFLLDVAWRMREYGVGSREYEVCIRLSPPFQDEKVFYVVRIARSLRPGFFCLMVLSIVILRAFSQNMKLSAVAMRI